MLSAMDTVPKLSVIIIVRNSVGTIARALDSIIAQHYPNLEVIVWDGLSTDGTLEVIQKYSSLVTVLKSERDHGPPDAYNKAIALTTGDFVGCLNADDEYEPGALWTVGDAIARQPDAEVVSFGIIYRSQDGRDRMTVGGYYADDRQLSLALECVLTENQTFLLSRFFKKSLFAEVGPFNFDRNFWYYSNDREWTTRLALRGCRNAIIPKALYGFSFGQTTLSNNPENYTRIIEEHMMIADNLLARTDLSETHRRIVKRWRNRQLVFGFWQALAGIKIDKAEQFMKQGLSYGKANFLLLTFYLPIMKVLKKFGLRLSGGIDRGKIRV